MTMQTDVKAASLTASGTAFAGRTRVRGIVISDTTTAGSLKLRDGGSGGTILFSLDTPNAALVSSILIPGEGVLFQTDVYVEISNLSSVVVFYG
jgi:hypothetical protein